MAERKKIEKFNKVKLCRPDGTIVTEVEGMLCCKKISLSKEGNLVIEHGECKTTYVNLPFEFSEMERIK
jgi:hypothetical protein